MRSSTSVRVVVARLDALEVEDRDAAQARQLAGEADVDDGIHGGREDRDAQAQAGELDAGVDVGGLDRLGPGASETSSKP